MGVHIYGALNISAGGPVSSQRVFASTSVITDSAKSTNVTATAYGYDLSVALRNMQYMYEVVSIG